MAIDKRIIDLPNESTTVTDDMYIMADSDQNGTTKYQLSRITNEMTGIIDPTLTIPNKAADAKAAGDAIAAKADADGTYPDMTVGTAQTLDTDSGVTDSMPYLYRQTGGGIDGVGRRAVEEIVGGTVAWNQLVKNGNFVNTDNWYSDATSFVVQNNVATAATRNVTNNYFSIMIPQDTRRPVFKGHKYLVSAVVQSPNYVGIFPDGSSSHGGLPYSKSPDAKKRAGTIWACEADDNLYFAVRCYTGNNITADLSLTIENCVVHDLTQMFGSTIADYIYSLEQSTAGAGVAFFRKLFPNDYYPYDAGTLKSVEGVSAKECVGKNLLPMPIQSGSYANNVTITVNDDLSFVINKPGASGWTVFELGTFTLKAGTYSIYEFDDNSQNASISLINNATDVEIINTRYTSSRSFTIEEDTEIRATYARSANAANVLTKLMLTTTSGQTVDDYSPYTKRTYPLDSDLTLRGIPKLVDGKLAYDGDTYASDGTVIHRFGTFTADGNATVDVWNGDAFYIIPPSEGLFVSGAINVLSDRLPSVTSAVIWGKSGYGISNNNNGRIGIRVSGVTTKSDLITWLTNNPLTIVYELATPTTETADPYTNPQIVDPNGTEEFITTGIVPVGHNTKYLTDLVKKIESLPSLPTAAGTYRLKVTVTSGKPSYEWVSG